MLWPRTSTPDCTTELGRVADRIFAQLAENGNVKMPIQETFWASRFGMVDDRFGTPWMVNCQAAPK
jgi:PhnB protein